MKRMLMASFVMSMMLMFGFAYGTEVVIVIPSTATGIDAYAFKDRTEISSVTMPDSVTSIGFRAFSGCENLKSVSLSPYVTSIGGWAFYKCKSLTNIALPDRASTYIEKYAFYRCTSLTKAFIPSGVKLDDGVFAACTSLKSIEVSDVNPYYTTQSGVLFDRDKHTLLCFPAGKCGSYIIPEGVTDIYYSAFDGCIGLTDVTIPNGVTQICNCAFDGCTGLTSMIIPSSVRTIYPEAFINCSALAHITIGAGVTVLGWNAFYGCKNLNSVEFYGIPPAAFSGAGNGLKNACINKSALIRYDIAHADKWLPVIAECGFTNAEPMQECLADGGPYAEVANSKVWNYGIENKCAILGYNGLMAIDKATDGSVIIPTVLGNAFVTRVESDAFVGCSEITKLQIPISVTEINVATFSGCDSLESFEVAAGNSRYASVDGLLFDNAKSTLECCPGGLSEVVIPDGTVCIAESAFKNCSEISTLSLPSSMTTVGADIFKNCARLTSVTIPACITSLADAFQSSYENITNVVFSAGVTSIGDNVFRGCSNLTSVVVPSSVTIVNSAAFCDCRSLTDVTVPGWKCNMDFTSVERLKIAEGTAAVADNAFQGCGELKSVTIPESVTSIGDSAFRGCSGMLLFEVAASNQNYKAVNGMLLTKDGETLVAGVNGNVVIPTGVTMVSKFAFFDCSAVTSVEIPSSVTSIGDMAFYNCGALTSLKIPSSVTTVGTAAFDNSGITEIWTDVGDSERIKTLLKASRMDVDGIVFREPSNQIEYCNTKDLANPNPTSVWISAGIMFKALADVGGWRFVGWLPIGVETGHVGDVVAAAQWEWITNCVTFVVGDHGVLVNGMMAVQKVPYLSCADIPEVKANANWQFDGWRTEIDGGVGVTAETIITNDAIFYATWTRLDPIPEVPDNATSKQIADALTGSADAKLVECITNAANYNAYREWAGKVKAIGGAEAVGAETVKGSKNAWLSFALDSETLIENAPKEGDVAVDKFEPTSESGKFDFTISVKDVKIGSEAAIENLKQVFGLDGGTSLDANDMSSANVDIAFGTPEDGKVKLTAGPKDTKAGRFFMKVKMTP